MELYVEVYSYKKLVLLIRTKLDRIPEEGEKFELNLDEESTTLLKGEWTKEECLGKAYSFSNTEACSRINDDLPVVECQLATEEFST